jgi:SAM-dependent methyltransferase
MPDGSPGSKRRVDYDEVAPVYDRRYRDGGSPEIAALVRAECARAGARPVLEVGCGTGRWVREALEAGARPVGLDPSPGMLERARALVPAAALVQGRAEALPFPDRLFGAVLCIFVVHHLDDAPRFVTEAARVLAAGGTLSVLGLAPRDGQDRWYLYDYFEGVRAVDARFPTTADVAGWMEEAGLSGVRAEVAARFVRTAAGAAVFEDPILHRHGTCHLSLLSDEEFERGMERIRAAIARDPGTTFATDLRIFATVGHKPAS